jgi:transposase-like protein
MEPVLASAGLLILDRMFVGNGKTRKPKERAEARRLRREEGLPYKQIARRLGVSPESVHNWARDIPISEEHRKRNLAHMTPKSEVVMKRAKSWSETNRRRRREFQADGRRRARAGDALHEAGCMLYWAEGAKDRNCLSLANSDPHMVRFFKDFLVTCFHLAPDDFSMKLNVYLGNGLSIGEIEDHWLGILELPRTCLRKHVVNHFPTSSSGKKTDRLPYGVCALSVRRSTPLVQHIFGAIQEYGGFDQPRWLDGPPRKARKRRTRGVTSAE